MFDMTLFRCKCIRVDRWHRDVGEGVIVLEFVRSDDAGDDVRLPSTMSLFGLSKDYQAHLWEMFADGKSHMTKEEAAA
jgi:hypothetical protein